MPIVERIERPEAQPVVFLHGTPGDRTVWSLVARALEGEPLSMWHFEAFDHGRAPDFAGATMTEVEEDLDTAIRASDRPVLLCGVSLGAYLAARAAARLGRERILGIVACAGFASLSEAAVNARLDFAHKLRAGALTPSALLAAVKDGLVEPAKRPREVDAILTGFVAEVPAERLARTLERVASLSAAEAAVSRYHVPAMVLHAKNDPFSPPSDAEALVQSGAKAELSVVDGSSHFLPLSDPAFVARKLRELHGIHG